MTKRKIYDTKINMNCKIIVPYNPFYLCFINGFVIYLNTILIFLLL